MTDIFQPQAQPGVPMAPPSTSELLSQMKPEPSMEPVITAKQRLLLAPKALQSEVRAAEPVPFVPEQINAQARMAQYLETDPDDSVWRKLATRPDVLKDKPGKSLQKLLAGSALPEPEWDELKTSLSQVSREIADIPDDLTVGAGKVTAVYTGQDGVWSTVEFPDGELPGSLTGDSTGLIPDAALAWPAAKSGITVFAGPSDVVYAAPDSEQNDRRLRNLYPGPLGKDGVPRWLPVTPEIVPSHRAVEAQTVAQPGLKVDSYVRQEHYPGTKGGDWIVWDVSAPIGPKQWKPPAWMQGRAQRIPAGVASSQPKYGLKPVGKAEIVDQMSLDDHLDNTSWGVFEAQGDPQSTSHLVSRLKRQGLEPIELEGGERRAWLVFGVDPEKASELSPKRPVYTNDGVVGDSEPEPQQFHFSTASGRVVFQTQPGLTTGAIPRTQRRAERWQFKVDPDQEKRLPRFASDLEAIGARNVSIYAHSTEVAGFEPAREHLYSDGVSLKVVRSKSKTTGESNSIPLFVRSVAGLPE